MIHLPNDASLTEIRRVLTLIQESRTANKGASTSGPERRIAPAQQTPGAVGGSSGGGSGGAGIPGPQGPAGADGRDASELMIGAMTVVEPLLDVSGDVLTDENGYALLGVHVESIVMTGAGDTIQAMGV